MAEVETGFMTSFCLLAAPAPNEVLFALEVAGAEALDLAWPSLGFEAEAEVVVAICCDCLLESLSKLFWSIVESVPTLDFTSPCWIMIGFDDEPSFASASFFAFCSFITAMASASVVWV